MAKAGAFSVVIEKTAEPLARAITERIAPPTIGIGASACRFPGAPHVFDGRHWSDIDAGNCAQQAAGDAASVTAYKDRPCRYWHQRCRFMSELA